MWTHVALSLIFLAGADLVASEEVNLMQLCEALGSIRYEIFPLSTALKRHYCRADKTKCFAFQMFSANDFAKGIDQFQNDLGCSDEAARTIATKKELCTGLTSLPDNAGTTLVELFGAAEPSSPYHLLLKKMKAEVDLWLLPIVSKLC